MPMWPDGGGEDGGDDVGFGGSLLRSSRVPGVDWWELGRSDGAMACGPLAGV